VEMITLLSHCEESPEEATGVLGEMPYNKLKIVKKFAVSLCKVLDSMNIPTE